MGHRQAASSLVLSLGLGLGLMLSLQCVVAAQYSGEYRPMPTPYTPPLANQPEPETVIFVLDASDSMNESIEGRPKIEIAKSTILEALRSIPPHVNVGLRVYGHRLGSGGGFFSNFSGSVCRQSQLMVPPAYGSRAQIASQLASVRAVGKTMITYSLQQAVVNDFAGIPGRKTLVLVSDGRETCAANPCDYALEMVRSGIQIKVNAIGFGTHDPVADDQLKCVAMSTKGRFYTANTAAELAKGLAESSQVQTRVQARLSP